MLKYYRFALIDRMPKLALKIKIVLRFLICSGFIDSHEFKSQ